MDKKDLLYKGKAKSIYKTCDNDKYIMHYRDDATAFNGLKKNTLTNKGKVNNLFNAFIMEELEKNNIQTHFIKVLNDNESLVNNLKMLPIECVVRNIAAGSISRNLGIEQGTKFENGIFEFFYKSDELNDPMVNESHILNLKWATKEQIETMKNLSFKVNNVLKPLFKKANLLLVDYKLEFGILNNKDIVLGDEFTPDGCRLWDINTLQSLDKDRFRKNYGNVIEAYLEVAKRLQIKSLEDL